MSIIQWKLAYICLLISIEMNVIVEYLPDNWNISAYGIVCQQILPVVAWNSSCKQCINISTPFLLLAVILYNKLFFVIGHNLSHDIYIGSDWALYKKPFTGQACTSDWLL